MIPACVSVYSATTGQYLIYFNTHYIPRVGDHLVIGTVDSEFVVRKVLYMAGSPNAVDIYVEKAS